VSAWWGRLPKAMQAWLTVASLIVALVAGAFALGAMSSQSFETARALPARMDGVEAATLELDLRLNGHEVVLDSLRASDLRAEAKYNRLICLMLLPDELSAVESMRRCP